MRTCPSKGMRRKEATVGHTAYSAVVRRNDSKSPQSPVQVRDNLLQQLHPVFDNSSRLPYKARISWFFPPAQRSSGPSCPSLLPRNSWRPTVKHKVKHSVFFCFVLESAPWGLPWGREPCAALRHVLLTCISILLCNISLPILL